MVENVCKDCQHYMQHYGLDNHHIFRVFCGHCTFTRGRKRQPDTPACEHFLPGSPATNAFVTKEYLSKELLKHVLELDLLPEIE